MKVLEDHPVVNRVIDLVSIDPDGLRADVGDRGITAKTPQAMMREVAGELYNVIHSGRPAEDGPGPRTLRDRQVEAALREATPHRVTLFPGRTASVGSDRVLVRIDGVNIALPATQNAPSTATPGQRVLVPGPAVRAGLSPGFFLVDGSVGRPTGRPLLRLYVNIPEITDAPAVWSTVIATLEDQQVGYRAKISSSTRLYPRRDALVVYLGASARSAVGPVVRALAGAGGVGTETSPLCRELAPGIAMAWEPVDDRAGRRGQSFGEHRCGVLAEGLIKHAVLPFGRSAATAVRQAFIDAGVDDRNPYRNVNSPFLPDF